MAGIATRKRIERQKRDRRLKKLANFAERAVRGELPDKLDEMLSGIDDDWQYIREKIVELGGERGEWAGYPLPVEHAELVIEPRHPLFHTLDGSSLAKKPETGERKGSHHVDVINAWHDHNRGRDVYIYREDGKICHAVIPTFQSTRRANLTLETLGASQAWSVRAEFTAMSRLKKLVSAAAFRYYLLTGTFIESSKRSDVFYLFRKCRPTLAFNGDAVSDKCKLLAALCLHPIGYYRDTFAGSMVPTDDVIAHLLMMRGDERKFWSKCNQHDCRVAEAGV